MLWKEDPVTGDRICICPPLCDGCRKVRRCLEAGVPLPRLTERRLKYDNQRERRDPVMPQLYIKHVTEGGKG